MKLLKLHAPWCGPCKAYAPIVWDATQELGLTYEDVNIDDNPDIVSKYNVRGVPSIVLDLDTHFHMITGMQTKDNLKKWIEDNMPTKRKPVNREELTKLLLANNVKIRYNKVTDNDKETDIVGTLQESEVSKYAVAKKDENSTRKVNEDIIHFIAPDRQGWRSVRLDKIISYEIVE